MKKKEIYEAVMSGVSKEVKKALLEFDPCEINGRRAYARLREELVEKGIDGENGIADQIVSIKKK